MIYLDNAASYKEANPHSIHIEGLKAKILIKKAEIIIKDHINGHRGRIIWTSSGSMANYWALKKKDCFITSSEIEHKSILEHPFINGFLSYEQILEGWSDSDLITHMLANNETGQIFDVSWIKDTNPDALLHVDAVAALGKIQIDVEKLQCDTLSLSAHKIGGPQGLGVLWVRDGVEVNVPYLGTPNVKSIVNFAQIIKNIVPVFVSQILYEKENWFYKTLTANLSENEVFLNPHILTNKIAGILNLSFPNVDKDELQLLLSDKGVMVGTGSACGKGDSHVLKAMGLSEKRIKSAIRVSFNTLNTYEECTQAAKIIAETIKELKNA